MDMINIENLKSELNISDIEETREGTQFRVDGFHCLLNKYGKIVSFRNVWDSLSDFVSYIKIAREYKSSHKHITVEELKSKIGSFIEFRVHSVDNGGFYVKGDLVDILDNGSGKLDLILNNGYFDDNPTSEWALFYFEDRIVLGGDNSDEIDFKINNND